MNKAAYDILPDNIQKYVDLAVFAGQSNMSGRGDAADAPICDANAGFEYKSVSMPNTLVRIKEPFGLGEDQPGGIYDINDDGTTKRSGSIVSAAVNEYYRCTGRQLVAVSASIGGTTTIEWKKLYIFDAVRRLDRAKDFLTRNGINIGRIFVVWSQGESDGDNSVTAQEHTSRVRELFAQFKAHGAEKCFMIQTGHYNYKHPCASSITDENYGVIRAAQAALCGSDEDFMLAGSFEPYIDDMRDLFHYYQRAYNSVGSSVGRAIAEFYG